ncbi:hypothetical protein K505DRAFT_339738 [Melanomma pulvis-pyrius CBS 109.77]|uniref:BTB domain-containing protein n=1 Tax=Melanomma pulvis-pyrius CBS 109.77 TaxID=1314802 RepID=A0A6A6X402_9PLEO|nr:hypothetical protein K505DRAFT_339738 [Melanomma pulvis-pyrius CBS 109.77]
MAVENYFRDLSEYLTAAYITLQETDSGAITLNDGPEFADAVDCMVSYFYKAGYNASDYTTSESLLHAQIVTIADKYDCASLYKLARTSFAKTVNDVDSDEWVAIAALIYDYTITDLLAHLELRSLVVGAVADRPGILETIPHKESMTELLRSDADLATDLLLAGLRKPKAKDHLPEYIFMCDHCQYVHIGSRNCSNVVRSNDLRMICPYCGKEAGTTSKRYVHTVDLFKAFLCPSCDGRHTREPES